MLYKHVSLSQAEMTTKGEETDLYDDSTVLDDCLPARTDFPIPTPYLLNLLDHVQALDDLAKDDVFATDLQYTNIGERPILSGGVEVV